MNCNKVSFNSICSDVRTMLESFLIASDSLKYPLFLRRVVSFVADGEVELDLLRVVDLVTWLTEATVVAAVVVLAVVCGMLCDLLNLGVERFETQFGMTFRTSRLRPLFIYLWLSTAL
ncbi:hypothetical protein WICPIJ_001538 [Wickerhamomyces pijperi]|uniref:Uncharacterized protein n=1 Tax=Wickerhamomyces pijperi TaxID=599730 RepID=A0A9P8QD38_WICPI|nr:hypothetical protein WICPIJ_001538 [Wickerhamomyces pijperi]